jgi:metallophosphoesterase (TIGR00282 family)
MRILFLGDVTGKSGRAAVIDRLGSLKAEYSPDFTIVNGENSAHGKGITGKIYRSLKAAGADVITLGNHAFSKKEILNDMDGCPDLVRPLNMEPLDAGSGWIIRECCGKKIAVVNLLGTVFMDGYTEEPVPCMERLLPKLHADIIFVDLHAEATSEKELFFQYFHDRLTAVIGTHTHVQTADERVKGGCAFLSDAGMCGVYDSILGRDIDEVLRHSVRKEPTHFLPAEGPAVLCGALIDIDDQTNRAVHIERIQKRPE